MTNPARVRPLSAAREFLQSEAAGGVVLMVAAALGLVAANSAWAEDYFHALHIEIGPFSLLHWINDGLMSIFFLLVGVEIKREMLDGQLATWPRRILPGLAAMGGMAAPALIYLTVTQGDAEAMRGWATPAATDIAFTLGVLALLGPKVPISLKIFVTALAILDDLGAVLIIAIFYTDDLSLLWLGGGAAIVAVLAVLNWRGVRLLWPYLLLGLGLWVCVLQSGVHATVAGVILAMTIPLKRSPARPDDPSSPLHKLEHALAGTVAFAIVPIFGFANAGVSLEGLGLEALLAPVTLGVAAGLFAGKQVGVFAASWLTIKLKLADRPDDASMLQLYGVALLCGIGFTMSLFIGLLAFPSSETLQSEVKLGVLVGSALSTLVGVVVLSLARGDGRAAAPAS
ncbi:Na+/H+ antiporter NhaA [Phenylobacterium sp.]|uniref:Na+/H+ antiporter NhaA n=1 Tax=Phenylobacterium sp. TaxID=1871053 RepID=UPI0035B30DCC